MLRNLFMAICCAVVSGAAASAGPIGEMQRLEKIEIDRTEVTVGQFRRYVTSTGAVTSAERAGGGLVYEGGWTKKKGWTWRSPFGVPATDKEPAVHVTFDEAQAYCRWVGKRLPTDGEWTSAAYREQRISPPPPFRRGARYPYPTGASPAGAHCLGDCGSRRGGEHGDVLARGSGHVAAGTAAAGVNGLYDMGANVWEWVDSGDGDARITRGGSWWYGAAQMREDHVASKPRDMAVVYIGFRCVRVAD
jgi:sulfatase modifying factor 1